MKLDHPSFAPRAVTPAPQAIGSSPPINITPPASAHKEFMLAFQQGGLPMIEEKKTSQLESQAGSLDALVSAGPLGYHGRLSKEHWQLSADH